jgi:hypothetical protein
MSDNENNFSIIYRNTRYPIKTKTILWSEFPEWKASDKNKVVYKKKRKINLFVNHWDACRSSKDCFGILEKRGLSVHFLIDSDGTIYQTMDLNDLAYHAKGANERSVGVEIANPVELKYQDKKNPRPIMSGASVHGKILNDFLWFYPEQINALMILWETVHNVLGISLKCLLNENGDNLTTVKKDLKNFESGFISHFHVPRTDGVLKIDVAGLDIKSFIEKIITKNS